MNTKKFLGMLLLVMFCIICFPGHAQVVPAKLDVTFVVDCENFQTKSMIENIVKRELRKLKDVNLQDKIPGKFILNIIAVESGCNICGRISITSLFLTRQTPIPRFMIRDEYLNTYETLTNTLPVFGVPKIYAGYCSRDRLEEHLVGTVDDFDKQVLEIKRLSNQLRSEIPKMFDDSFQQFQHLEELLEKNR